MPALLSRGRKLAPEHLFWKDRTYVRHVPLRPSDPRHRRIELARLIDDQALAERLETAYGNGARILALEIQERESIVRALDDPPTKALAELRGVLLEEHVWRQRECM